MKVSIVTLGCKVNQAESATLEGLLREGGHEIVDHHDNPDVCVVNTCTVTAKSDYQSRQLIRRAIKRGARVIATGCYAQSRPEELSGIEGVALVLGNSEKGRIPEYIQELTVSSKAGCSPKVLVTAPETPVKSGPYSSSRARAFLKIQDGCNLSCSYCAIPAARGRSRSLRPEEIIRSVERFYAEGYREVVLTGVHIGSYGLDLQPRTSLPGLIERIALLYPPMRLRLSSIEPQEFKKEYLSLIKSGAVCPHLHIPLQSGSDRILRVMNRGYKRSFFRALIEEIASVCPDIALGTDVIVGFPGEAEEDFEDTLSLIKELPFTYIHAFPYSKRPNTVAESLPGQISNRAKKERLHKLLEIAKMKKNAYISKQLWKKLDVIVEERVETDGFYRAISDNYIRLLVRGDGLRQGQRLTVKALSVFHGELICEPLGQTSQERF